LTEKAAAESTDGSGLPKVTVYTTSWCPDCKASKKFLNQHRVPFTEFDIEEDPSKAEDVVRLNHGLRRVPTIVIEGGPTLAEPSDRELGEALGIA
jgi:glutaredoxin